jgi:small subunit ribosomal protein S5
VVGNEHGWVGVGHGKAREVPEAIRKANEYARRNLFEVPLSGATIPHEVLGLHGPGRVLLRPASAGTGVIAGGPVRAVVECAGIHDVLSKCIGTNNHLNVIHATMNALKQLRSPDQVALRRGLPLAEMQA